MIPADDLAGLGPATIIQGDARNLPLPDESVDLVVTSPPYLGLRSYTDGGAHYDGQIGSEATPREFVAALVDCTREMVRVLKPSGSIWVNLGDSYSAYNRNRGPGGTLSAKADPGRGVTTQRGLPAGFPAAKSLIGVSWRYALACIGAESALADPDVIKLLLRDVALGVLTLAEAESIVDDLDDYDRHGLGLILRAEVIWSKPNGLPESVTDRVRRSHEQWFHFVKQPRYFAAVDEIRELHLDDRVNGMTWDQRKARGDAMRQGEQNGTFGAGMPGNPLGKLPGSVREVPSAPLKVPAHLGVDHFAAFPPAWPAWIIRAWSPTGICTVCGEGRRPVRGVDWSKVPHHMVEKRALTAAETAAWCSEFADWCDAAGVSRAGLDEAAGTSDMGGWWASRLPHRAAVPTREQWAKIRARFGPPKTLDDLVHLTRTVPVADIEDGSGHAVTGRHNRKAKSMSFGDYGTITGYACACPTPDAPTRAAVVLDPFGGTGTTAMAARALGRHGISVDLSNDYCRLARWRCGDLDELRAVRGLQRRRDTPADGTVQVSLFDVEAAG